MYFILNHYYFISVDEIVLNVDLAATFLDIGGVPTPPHMDGRSILPLLVNRHRNAKDRWPDTFLIESSGRRETPEQIAEMRARQAAMRFSAKANKHYNATKHTKHKERPIDFSSHEHETDNEDDEDDDDAGIYFEL